ncbi:MAG: lipoprotein [Pseudomonadota bacterium]
MKPAILLLAALALTLAACGRKGDPKPPPPEPAEIEQPTSD